MHSMQVVEQALADAGMHKDSIDFLVLHQANQRILDSAAQRLGVPAERVVSNLAGDRPSCLYALNTFLSQQPLAMQGSTASLIPQDVFTFVSSRRLPGPAAKSGSELGPQA